MELFSADRAHAIDQDEHVMFARHARQWLHIQPNAGYVSTCVIVITFGRNVSIARLTWSGSIAWPSGADSTRTSALLASAIVTKRPAKTPDSRMRTRSPGSTRLARPTSIASVPDPAMMMGCEEGAPNRLRIRLSDCATK